MLLDTLLLAMVIIWGANYSIVKFAIGGVPPLAFNAGRLVLASTVFGIALAVRARRRSERHLLRFRQLWLLALVGNTLYQIFFIVALSRTTAANSSLIIGCTPVFVAVMTAALGHERIPAARWAGVLLSSAGIYLVVGRGAGVTRESFQGDLLMIVAVFCWSAAALISRPLLSTEEPFDVTAWSMLLGTAMYVPLAIPAVRTVDWATLQPVAWMAMVFSGLFALCVSYVIWYTAIQRLGNTRTAIYSNMVPVAGLAIAWMAGEVVGLQKLTGAALIVSGVALTRLPPARMPFQPVAE